MAEVLYLLVLVAGSTYFFLHLVALPCFNGKICENLGFSAILHANLWVILVRLSFSGMSPKMSSVAFYSWFGWIILQAERCTRSRVSHDFFPSAPVQRGAHISNIDLTNNMYTSFNVSWVAPRFFNLLKKYNRELPLQAKYLAFWSHFPLEQQITPRSLVW